MNKWKLLSARLRWAVAHKLASDPSLKKIPKSTLSEIAGVSPPAVSYWFMDTNGMKADQARKLANYFGVDAIWLEKGDGEPINDGSPAAAERNAEFVRTKGLLPLISWVQAGAWGDIVNDFAPGDAEDWIPCPFNHGPGAFILKVVGLSMYNPAGDKSYAPGEYIAVDPNAEALNKRMVVARVDHEEKATFKQLIMGDDGVMMLRALNPAYSPSISAMPPGSVIAGVVIGKWTPEIF